MITVTVLLGILSIASLVRYQDLSEGALDAAVDATYSIVISYLLVLNGRRYNVCRQPE